MVVGEAAVVAGPRSKRRNVFDLLRPLRRLLRKVEAAQVKRFGRSLLSVVFRTPVLVLVTTGRKTGRRRETALAYERLESGDLVVVGGAGGQQRLPDWVANARAHPDVTVIVDRESRAMSAIEIDGHERERIWEQVRKVWPQIDTYEERAGRPIPVFVLQEDPLTNG